MNREPSELNWSQPKSKLRGLTKQAKYWKEFTTDDAQNAESTYQIAHQTMLIAACVAALGLFLSMRTQLKLKHSGEISMSGSIRSRCLLCGANANIIAR